MIPFTCPCCEVDRPPHRDGCTLHADCPTEAATFDEVSALRAEVDRLSEERRWIPVGERLPEFGVDVLAIGEEDGVFQARLESWGGHYRWRPLILDCHGCGCCGREMPSVTNWMPLPAPPKGGEVGE